jgi:hypothetical protein
VIENVIDMHIDDDWERWFFGGTPPPGEPDADARTTEFGIAGAALAESRQPSVRPHVRPHADPACTCAD